MKWLKKKWTPYVMLSALLLGSFVLKSPCLFQSWGGEKQIQYRLCCYNDLQALYGARHLDERRFPYIEEKSYEYPPLIAIQMWVASLISSNHVDFFFANLPFNSLAAFLALFGLILAQKDREKLLWYVFSPFIFLYVYMNWDITTVACVALAMGMWARGYVGLSFFLLGLGASGKLFPVLIIAPLLMSIYQKERKPILVFQYLGWGFLGWGLLNIPLIVIETFRDGWPNGWLNVFVFHIKRLPELNTIWHWIGGSIGMDSTSQIYKALVDKLSFALFFIGTGAILTYQWTNKNTPWRSGGAILCLCLLLSKVYSPQYALWLLPFIILLPIPSFLILGFYSIELISFVSIFRWFGALGTPEESFWHELVMWAVLIRSLIFFSLIYSWGFNTSRANRGVKKGEDNRCTNTLLVD